MTQARRGVLFGLGAYVIWGLFPLYWPLLEPAGPVEILAHRVLWTGAAVVILLVARRRLSALRRLTPRQVGLLAAAAAFIAVNWGLYIYGVNSEQVVETSLGYFINPLVSVLLGVVVLGERLRRAQVAAVALATVAVAVLTADYGRPPWLALALAASFASYGLIKKVVGVGTVESLATETAVLAPAAAGVLLWLTLVGEGTFGGHGTGHAALLVLSGVVTALPLLMFGSAASRLPLTTLGLLQYLTPCLQLLIGVLVQGEPLPPVRLAGFALVWMALLVLSVDALRGAGQRRSEARDRAAQEPALTR